MKLRRRDNDGIRGPYLDKACANVTNTYLTGTSELNKAAFAAGTTLMTLLPSLLTFAPLPTAKIRDSMCTSPWLAMFTAGFIFGLPVTQYSSAKTFKKEEFFARHNSGPGSVAQADGAEQLDNTTVREKLFPSEKRLLWRSMVIITIFGGGQWILFLSLIFSFFNFDGFTVVWACGDLSSNLFPLWLSLTFLLSCAVLIFWNSGSRKRQIVLHCFLRPTPPITQVPPNVEEDINIACTGLRRQYVLQDDTSGPRDVIFAAGWRYVLSVR